MSDVILSPQIRDSKKLKKNFYPVSNLDLYSYWLDLIYFNKWKYTLCPFQFSQGMGRGAVGWGGGVDRCLLSSDFPDGPCDVCWPSLPLPMDSTAPLYIRTSLKAQDLPGPVWPNAPCGHFSWSSTSPEILSEERWRSPLLSGAKGISQPFQVHSLSVPRKLKYFNSPGDY